MKHLESTPWEQKEIRSREPYPRDTPTFVYLFGFMRQAVAKDDLQVLTLLPLTYAGIAPQACANYIWPGLLY